MNARATLGRCVDYIIRCSTTVLGNQHIGLCEPNTSPSRSTKCLSLTTGAAAGSGHQSGRRDHMKCEGFSTFTPDHECKNEALPDSPYCSYHRPTERAERGKCAVFLDSYRIRPAERCTRPVAADLDVCSVHDRERRRSSTFGRNQ